MSGERTALDRLLAIDAHGEKRTGLSRIPLHLRRPLKLPESRSEGVEVISDPLYNKGTAFPEGERDRLRLRGLLPPTVTTMELQVKRFMKNLRALPTDIAKALMLSELQDRNESLYHRVLVEHTQELLGIVYTPTVGRVCQEYGSQFTKPRGMYFSANDKNHMQAMVHNWPAKDVQVVVVTDGSRILGLGDLGCNGMGIPIGKLALYCAAGGIAPHRVLPCVIDVGTDNADLLEDEYYLGLRQPRLKGDAYVDLIDEFMHAIYGRWPNALVQFEDFSSDKASSLLNRYRDHFLCFNDDIQGTGAVTLAGILTALRQQGKPVSALKDERFLIVGAGSAGIGVADAIASGMIDASGGAMTMEEARKQFYIVDSVGLMTTNGATEEQLKRYTAEKLQYASPATDLPKGAPLLDIIKDVKPTALLGLSGNGGLFTEEVLSAMGEANERPIIFPLSNPTSNAECTAEAAYRATDGRAIFASGSPFDPVTHGGKTFYPSQCNNVYIFPAVGLGASLAGATKITDSMLYESAVACAAQLNDEELARGQTFPDIVRIREVEMNIGAAVMRKAIAEGLSRTFGAEQLSESDAVDYVRAKMYYPAYTNLIAPPRA